MRWILDHFAPRNIALLALPAAHQSGRNEGVLFQIPCGNPLLLDYSVVTNFLQINNTIQLCLILTVNHKW